jgi:hypothetical protein
LEAGVTVENTALHRELIIQRRIFEHERDKARRDLAFAEERIASITREYMRHFTPGTGGDAR